MDTRKQARLPPVRIPEALLGRLNDIAKQESRTLSDVVRGMLREQVAFHQAKTSSHAMGKVYQALKEGSQDEHT
jgi:metal-responsive CopG/Arc/MetJ family transcriptional regulator